MTDTPELYAVQPYGQKIGTYLGTMMNAVKLKEIRIKNF